MGSVSRVSKALVQTMAKPGGQNGSMAHFWDVTTPAGLFTKLSPPAREEHGLFQLLSSPGL